MQGVLDASGFESRAEHLIPPLHVEADEFVWHTSSGTQHLQYRVNTCRLSDDDAVIPCDLSHVRKVGMAKPQSTEEVSVAAC